MPSKMPHQPLLCRFAARPSTPNRHAMPPRPSPQSSFDCSIPFPSVTRLFHLVGPQGHPLYHRQPILRPHPSLPPSASDPSCKTCQHRVSCPDETVMETPSKRRIETQANWKRWVDRVSDSDRDGKTWRSQSDGLASSSTCYRKLNGNLRLGPRREGMAIPVCRPCFIIDLC